VVALVRNGGAVSVGAGVGVGAGVVLTFPLKSAPLHSSQEPGHL
jgi:hypothetical protein